MTATETNTVLETGSCYACYGLSESEILQLAMLRSWLLARDPTADTTVPGLLELQGGLSCYGMSLFDILEIILLNLIKGTYADGQGGGGDEVLPALLVYYKFEEASDSTIWTDEVGDNDFYAAGGLDSVAGIIGNGFTNNSTHLDAFSSATYDFGGTSYTVRLWYWAPNNEEFGDGLIFRLRDYTTVKTICSVWRYGGGVDGFYFEMATNDNPDLDDSDGLVLTGVLVGQWNRVVLWYEDGVGFGFKLNNGATVTYADGSGIPSANYSFYVKVEGTAPPTGRMDELGIWTRKLTDAELLYDWNGGVGKSYPDVPP